jgi:CRISPR-associated protein Csb2
MFALGIRYLNGWAMATHPSNRERAEWPPHPDRVFMALAAAHFETSDEGGGDAEERAALEWLQSLPTPAIAVGDHEQREIVTSYVPVNDTQIARRGDESKRLAVIDKVGSLDKAKDAGLALMPEFRSRQSRSFPVAIPHVPDDAADGMPRVHLIWDTEVPGRHQNALASLSAKVTSIGHSASLVQMWVESEPPPATLVPLDGVAAKHRLRVSGDSRLEYLESRYKAGLRPSGSLWQGYGNPETVASGKSCVHSVFDPNLLILRRIQGPRLGLESTLQLTEALRGAVMRGCPIQPPPSWISGHTPTPDGKPSEDPHLAFIPVADVGHEHARGRLLGVAIVVPRRVSPEEQKALNPVLFYAREDESPDDGWYAGTPRQLDLTMGRAGVWRVELADEDPRVALRPEVWTGRTWSEGDDVGSTLWATVTPIVFDRHPKETWSGSDAPRVRAEKQAAYWREVESMIAEACERIGLPRPVEVTASPTSVFQGAPSSGQIPRTLRKDGTQKRQTHAVIQFDTRFVGPVLLGAGRYRGYGLCRPLAETGWEGGEA